MNLLEQRISTDMVGMMSLLEQLAGSTVAGTSGINRPNLALLRPGKTSQGSLR